MNQLVFKAEIVDIIKGDQVLFGKVANALDIATRTLSDKLPTLATNPKLATASVMKILRDHLKIENDSELLIELESA